MMACKLKMIWIKTIKLLYDDNCFMRIIIGTLYYKLHDKKFANYIYIKKKS